jgi:inosose dehydratase
MPPIVSCLTNSYGRFGARGAIENLRAAGLEYLELPIRAAGSQSIFGDEPLVTTESSGADVRAVLSLLADHGVQLASCNITSGNPLQRDVVDVTKRKLDIAAELGVQLVVGGAGEAADTEELAQLYKNLREIGDYAATHGITYCFETHPGICVNHRYMLLTMEELQHPNLRINFDTGNILYYNNNICVEVALAKVCPYVKHLHLKDSMGNPGEWYFPALGYGGAVDFLQVLHIMRGCGFRGPYSLELEGIRGEPELTLANYQQRIIDSVDTLKSCGYFD